MVGRTHPLKSAILGTLAFSSRFFTAALCEPAGIGLKSVTLALFVVNPSWTTALCYFAAFTFISTLLVTSAIHVGERALAALDLYIREHGTCDWVRTAHFTLDELREIYGFQHLTLKITREVLDRQLYMVSYEGNWSMDCRCYFNIAGSTFILAANAGAAFQDLPAAQKFAIYHELGHASFAGGEH